MTVGLDTDLMFRRILTDGILIVVAAFVAGVILCAIVKRWKGRTVWIDRDRKLADRLQREGRE